MPTWLIFLLVLSILVLIHELGHYLAARMFGIKVDEFAFGLPFTRHLISVKVGETKYSIYPLLFGGFVKLHGEESEVQQDKRRSFWSRGKKQRVVVIAAGVFMNFLLAIFGFILFYSVVGLPKEVKDKVTVVDISEGSPAKDAGFQQYDRVLKIENTPVTSTEDFTRIVKSWSGLGVNITVERGKTKALFEGLLEQDKEVKEIYVVPRKNPPEGQGALGVAVTGLPYLQTEKCPVNNLGCMAGFVKQGFKSTISWAGKVLEGLRQIGQSLAAFKKPEGVSGPVGIYQLTDLVAKEGWLPLLELTAVLSVNLGVFNILPIPALDGGRILFILIEWVRRKRISPEFEQKVNAWGMTILLGLVALITLQDLVRVGILQKLGIVK